MAETIIYSMVGVGKIYPPNKQVLKDIYLSYFYGAKIGVIGLNGSGKSTLLKIMAGIDKDFIGEAVLTPGYTVGYLPQEPELDPNKTAVEIVKEGAKETYDLLHQYDEISNQFAEASPDDFDKLIAKQAEIQDKIDALDAWNIDHKIEIAMNALACPPAEAKVEYLSGGEKRRLALARLLIQKPDILLLDEPTNHLDASSINWLEMHLQQYPGTVIAVTHDRYFLDHVAGWILELDRGQGIPYKGNYSSWLQQKQERLRQEEKSESKRQKTLQRELEWINMSPKAKQAKGKARLNAYEKLLSQEEKEKEQHLELYIPPGPRLGDLVISAQNLSKSFDDRVIIKDLTFIIPKGAIVGIIGPNGAGKTTLFKMIVGKEKPDAGSLQIGPTVVLGYADQEHADLNPEDDVFTAITGGNETILLGNKEVNARAYCSKFNFSGTEQTKKVKVLSGGERNRVHLARVLKSGANVLLLDEPTNDIDVNTLRALEEGIENFGGCALIISHDRWFLDRVCTHIMAFEGDGIVEFYEGSFSEYEAFRTKKYGKVEDRKAKYRTIK